jgi:aminopeptidase YwaD
MLKPFLSTVFILQCTLFTHGQNRQYAQKTIDTLSSATFYGRGYVHQGDYKAAKFIANAYKSIGLLPFKTSGYFYPFSFTVNTFPSKCVVKVNGKKLIPGLDYIVNPTCPNIHKKLKVAPLNTISNQRKNTRNMALVFDTSYKMSREDLLLSTHYALKINLQKKLTWSVATEQSNHAGIDILKDAWNENSKTIRISIKAKLIKHQTNNIIAYIDGTDVKDTFILLTAHYDHLGMMGSTIFPGANDNASGIAMMLDLATYFKQNPCKYSMAFIAFAGEEPGLIGSKHYTNNPWDELPLGKIKFLINLDLMGSGEKGMAVVNATTFPEYFNKLEKVNSEKKYLTGFKRRGKAANSDHFWFVERGVKGFFFYLMGDYNHYHDINDNKKNLKLGEYYDKSYRLIRDFILEI